jgi:hypothetical protein
LPKKELRSLRLELKEVEPHNRDNNMLSRGGSMLSKVADMLTPTLFLVPEVEEGAVEESSHVSRVGKTDIKPLTVQRGRWMEENLTSHRRRGVMLKAKMRTAKDRLGRTKFFWHLRKRWTVQCSGADCSGQLA